VIDEFLTVSLYQPNEFISRKKDNCDVSPLFTTHNASNLLLAFSCYDFSRIMHRTDTSFIHIVDAIRHYVVLLYLILEQCKEGIQFDTVEACCPTQTCRLGSRRVSFRKRDIQSLTPAIFSDGGNGCLSWFFSAKSKASFLHCFTLSP